MKGIVSIYGKSGCKGNGQQKARLKAAGYTVQFIDILKKQWDVHTLSKFFNDQSVHACVNARAPQITSGEFDPSTLSEDALLQAMIETPILIKRPLLFYRGEFACGFDQPLVTQLLGEQAEDFSCDHTQKECP